MYKSSDSPPMQNRHKASTFIIFKDKTFILEVETKLRDHDWRSPENVLVWLGFFVKRKTSSKHFFH